MCSPESRSGSWRASIGSGPMPPICSMSDGISTADQASASTGTTAMPWRCATSCECLPTETKLKERPMEIIFILAAFVLGVAVSKSLRRWLVKLRADPRQGIEAEIAELKDLLDKYRV